MTNLEDAGALDGWNKPSDANHREDRWILSRLNQTAAQVQRFMDDCQFGEAQRVIHDFLWNEYCDWYIEMAKIRMRSGVDDGPSPLPVLAYVLERVLRLLHPFMPFVTEEIWQALVGHLPEEPGRPVALIVAPYPETDPSLIDEQAEREVGAVVEIVRAIRGLRAEFRIQTAQPLEAIVDSPELGAVIEAEEGAIKALARVAPLTVAAPTPAAKPGDRVLLVLASGTVTVPLGGLVDLGRERERLNGELEELDSNRIRLEGRLKDEQFLARAPEEVVERERQRLATAEERRTRITEILGRIGG
jgi:valyl-tRNA synthetase